MALEDCRTAAKLVDERVSGQYRVVTEGSVLGFGGERISAPERELLQRIDDTLGIKSGFLLA